MSILYTVVSVFAWWVLGAGGYNTFVNTAPFSLETDYKDGFSPALTGNTSQALSKNVSASNATSSVDPRLLKATTQYKTMFMTHMDVNVDTPLKYSQRLGRLPTGWNIFFQIENASKLNFSRVDTIVAGILRANKFWKVTTPRSVLQITVEPHCGLRPMNKTVFKEFGKNMKRKVLDKGIAVVIRYGHEMNYDWYPWGGRSKANEYISSFRLMAQTLRGTAGKLKGRIQFNWAPFLGHCGKPSDDPYGAWYPGDDVVDFVGLSLHQYMGKENKNVDPNYYYGVLTGWSGYWKNCNFPKRFAADKKKKFCFPESGAAYRPNIPNKPGATELTVKRAFWRMLLGKTMISKIGVPVQFVMYFERRKTMNNGELRDFRITANSSILNAFKADLKTMCSAAAFSK